MTMILGGNVIPELIREKIYFYMWRNKVLLCNQEYYLKFHKNIYKDFLETVIVVDDGNKYKYYRINLNVRSMWQGLYTINKFTASSYDKYVTNIELPENYVYSKTNIKEDIFWINDGKVTKYYHKSSRFDLE
jgi:hypothetical protein